MMQIMTMILPHIALILFSRIAPSLADSESCANDVIAMMQKDNDALTRATLNMIKSYNDTCKSLKLCDVQMNDDTAAYLDAATSTDAEPTLPDFPIQASMDGNFMGFTPSVYLDYKNICLKEGGYLKLVDVDLIIKGTAMDLVDIDLEIKIDKYPACLVSGCEDVEYKKVFENAVKHAVIGNAAEISEPQTAILNGMDISLACAAAGIDECSLSVVDSYGSASTKTETDETSGVLFSGRLTSLFVTLFCLWLNM